MADDQVLVTGASGFVAGHVVLSLLDAGWRVRGTVRSAARGEAVRARLAEAGAAVSRFDAVVADLASDEGWREAVAGCRFVQHVASPFPKDMARNKFALVPLARDGTLRVLGAALSAGVERVVLTSSVAAVWYGHADRTRTRFTEADVSNVDSPSISAYAVSKTLAEAAAWELLVGSRTELVVLNPSVIFGPLLGTEVGTSASLIRMMMQGRLPIVPDISLGIVDARDVAVAHLSAMTRAEAAGSRFILSSGTVAIRQIASVIAQAHPAYRRRMPRATLPDAMVGIMARFSSSARHVLPELGQHREAVSERAETILGVTFRSPRIAIETMAQSLIDRRLA